MNDRERIIAERRKVAQRRFRREAVEVTAAVLGVIALVAIVLFTVLFLVASAFRLGLGL